MSSARDTLWQTLNNAGVVSGEPPLATAPDSPWYVRTMLGISGWIAALFLLGFIAAGLEFLIDDETASIVTGVVMLAGAYTLFRRVHSDFYEQFGLAMSFTAQALILFGLYEIFGWDEYVFWWIFAAVQTVIALLIPNFVQRVIATYLALHTFSFAMSMHGAPFITATMATLLVCIIWINEYRWAAWGGAVRAIGYGMTLGLIQLKGQESFALSMQALLGFHGQFTIAIPHWLAQGISALLLIWLVAYLLRRAGLPWGSQRMLAGLGMTTVVALCSLQAPGLSIGLIIVLLGFSNSNRILVGLGIAALLFYLSSYYYSLETTLLIKSGILAATGLLLLISRWLLLRWVLPEQESANA